jgi:adenylate cyclase
MKLTTTGDPAVVRAGGIVSKRQAAIVAVDVVGYTRLMEADEAGTHALWKHVSTQLIEPGVGKRNGKIVKSTGDGFLIEFGNANDAVSWAIEIQDQVGELDQQSSSGPMRLRIAVNVGDIIVEAHDIFGSDVNIAARLQEMAEPGGIVISAAVHKQTQSTLNYVSRDLGLLRLKNIDRPQRAFAIGNKAFASPATPAIARHEHYRPSIAVMPMRSLGGGSQDQYFAEGIVHDIAASLANLKELFVVSSNSTICFRDAMVEPSIIGRQLGVRYLVTGTLARAADRLQVRVELSNVESRTVIWTDRYEFPAADVFAVQDTIATKVANALLPHLRHTELQRALRKRPENLDAYDLLLQGTYRLYRLAEGDLQAAGHLLQQAIDRDPNYAAPYAMMAAWYAMVLGQGETPDPEAIKEGLLRYARLAIERNDSDPMALAIFGHCMSYVFARYEQAIEAFDRAIRVSPNSPIAWGLSSPTYAYLGQGQQAVERAEHALRLSPLDPYAYYYQTALTVAHYANQTFEEAVKWGYRTMAANPRFTANLKILAASLIALGRAPEANQITRVILEIEPSFRVGPYCSWYPIKDLEKKRLFAERLRLAGLPE